MRHSSAQLRQTYWTRGNIKSLMMHTQWWCVPPGNEPCAYRLLQCSVTLCFCTVYFAQFTLRVHLFTVDTSTTRPIMYSKAIYKHHLSFNEVVFLISNVWYLFVNTWNKISVNSSHKLTIIDLFLRNYYSLMKKQIVQLKTVLRYHIHKVCLHQESKLGVLGWNKKLWQK